MFELILAVSIALPIMMCIYLYWRLHMVTTICSKIRDALYALQEANNANAHGVTDAIVISMRNSQFINAMIPITGLVADDVGEELDEYLKLSAKLPKIDLHVVAASELVE